MKQEGNVSKNKQKKSLNEQCPPLIHVDGRKHLEIVVC